MIKFNFPTQILFGKGCLNDLPAEIDADKYNSCLLVSDKGVLNAGLVEKVRKVFTANSLKLEIYSDIHSNPVEEDVTNGVETYRINGCDCIIALGGGSAIDVAKTIRFMVNHEQPLEQYDDALGGEKKIIHALPPMIAIPTTAGTGSEVGRSSVITLNSTGKKTVFFHPGLMPDIAVLDPELTFGLPPAITAATGMDAFTHCYEAYIVDGFHPMADSIALKGMEVIIKNLPVAVKKSKNTTARGNMLIAASMGATAFQKGLGMTHSMAHPLSGEFGLHHGLANALLLPESVELTWEKSDNNDNLKEKLNTISKLFGGELDGSNLSSQLKKFILGLGIIPGLKIHGISEKDIPGLSSLALEDQCHETHPFKVSRQDFEFVYRKSL